jgi:myo-inositol-1(or 4)-monophosphatase
MNSSVESARVAGLAAAERLRSEFGRVHEVNEELPNDIKLALDVESQRIISEHLLSDFPDHAVLGEEGLAGKSGSEYRWIVDPIDGTVNFFYGIPHFAVSIALERAGEIEAGVVVDPMQREVWSVATGGPPRLGEREISVSKRSSFAEAIVMLGFAKTPDKVDEGVKRYRAFAPRVRKVRMLGSAALAMTYVATGRLDVYVEETVSLWDIAAGKLLVEEAGGRVQLTPHRDREDRYSIVCWNGRLPVLDLLG